MPDISEFKPVEGMDATWEAPDGALWCGRPGQSLEQLVAEVTEQLSNPVARPPSEDDYRIAIEAHVNLVAVSKGYASADRIMNYASSEVAPWAVEARTFISWFSSVQLYAIEQLGLVMAGLRDRPTVDEFIGELPAIVWPA